MKLKKIRLFFIYFTAVFVLLVSGCKEKKETEHADNKNVNPESSELKEEKEISGEELGYAFGVIIAKTAKDNGLEINPNEILKGFKDACADSFDKNGLADAQMVLNQAYYYAQLKKAATTLAEGKKFLDENKKRSEVKVTESGLQYEILEEGTGNEHPSETDSVNVNYKGSFISGEIFDDSYKTENPVKINLSHVIPGWKEGIQLMTRGAKYKFYLPAELGYGENGINQNGKQIIPGNAVLIFEVELVSIAPAKVEPEKKD